VENIFQRTNIQRLSEPISTESLSSVVDKAHTGVAPYNGLADSTRPLPIARNQSDTITSDTPSRAESGCSAALYAPQYAPHRTETPSSSLDQLGNQRSLGRPVVRSPQQLRFHPAIEKLGWTCTVDELNATTRVTGLSLSEPIPITTSGVILDGFERWRFAILNAWSEIDCIEYPLDEHASLQFLVAHHRPRRCFNLFVRISLALTLEPYFRQKALENMQLGGKYKGLAKLPEAEHVSVRKKVADIAGAGDRNVDNVLSIWETAHPRLIEALVADGLKIGKAMQFCKLPKDKQLEQFVQDCEDREIDTVIRTAVRRRDNRSISLDTGTVLRALQQQEKRQAGSVVIRVGRLQRTVILVGQDLLKPGLILQREREFDL
jgi:hypothetical protein